MNSTRNKPPGVPQPFKQPQGHVLQNKISPAQRPLQIQTPRPLHGQPTRPPFAPVVQPAMGHSHGPSSVIQQGKPKGSKKKPQKRAVVTLTVGTREYSGVSSGQYGHAEMQALRKFITSYGSVPDASRALDRATKLKVLCPNQPVCGSCTIILEALGFGPRAGTVFSTRKSGGVSWGANMKVRELLEHRGLDGDYQRALRAGAK